MDGLDQLLDPKVVHHEMMGDCHRYCAEVADDRLKEATDKVLDALTTASKDYLPSILCISAQLLYVPLWDHQLV